MANLDPFTIFLALLGVAVAVGLAVVAGTITARIFFDATREPDEKP